MQFPLHSLAQESLQQIRDTLQRVKRAHESADGGVRPVKFQGPVESPKPDAVAWEDTEIDVRRLVP